MSQTQPTVKNSNYAPLNYSSPYLICPWGGESNAFNCSSYVFHSNKPATSSTSSPEKNNTYRGIRGGEETTKKSIMAIQQSYNYQQQQQQQAHPLFVNTEHNCSNDHAKMIVPPYNHNGQKYHYSAHLHCPQPPIQKCHQHASFYHQYPQSHNMSFRPICSSLEESPTKRCTKSKRSGMQESGFGLPKNLDSCPPAIELEEELSPSTFFKETKREREKEHDMDRSETPYFIANVYAPKKNISLTHLKDNENKQNKKHKKNDESVGMGIWKDVMSAGNHKSPTSSMHFTKHERENIMDHENNPLLVLDDQLAFSSPTPSENDDERGQDEKLVIDLTVPSNDDNEDTEERECNKNYTRDISVPSFSVNHQQDDKLNVFHDDQDAITKNKSRESSMTVFSLHDMEANAFALAHFDCFDKDEDDAISTDIIEIES